MALIMVTGPLGAGKSYYGVRKAREALEDGKVVITNFRMTPEWHERVVDRHPLRWLIPGRRRNLKAEWGASLLVVKDLEELLRVRVAGSKEGRGVVIIDEAHVFMNARSWRDEKRMQLVEWASASRKLGLDVYLITQDLQSLDRQVRDRLTYHVTLRNLRQLKIAGIPVVPFNVFLAIWQYHAAGKAIVKREIYRLVKWVANLYDTHDLGAFEALTDPEDVIQLPVPPHERRTANPARAAAPGAVGAAAPPGLDRQERSRRRLLELGHEIDVGEDAALDVEEVPVSESGEHEDV